MVDWVDWCVLFVADLLRGELSNRIPEEKMGAVAALDEELCHDAWGKGERRRRCLLGQLGALRLAGFSEREEDIHRRADELAEPRWTQIEAWRAISAEVGRVEGGSGGVGGIENPKRCTQDICRRQDMECSTAATEADGGYECISR